MFVTDNSSMIDARYVAVLAFALLLVGCYHARIETGLQPSDDVIDEPWALSWVYGLIPPETVEAGEQCPAGVAVVETRLSFLNQLVAGLTGGIFTPRHITVTCAAQGGTVIMEAPAEKLVLPTDAELAEVRETFRAAADEAVQKQQRVYIQFER